MIIFEQIMVFHLLLLAYTIEYIPQRGLPGALPMHYQGINYFMALIILLPDYSL